MTRLVYSWKFREHFWYFREQ